MWTCWLFTSFYVEVCLWHITILWQIQERNSKYALSFVQILGKVWWRHWQWLLKCQGDLYTGVWMAGQILVDNAEHTGCPSAPQCQNCCKTSTIHLWEWTEPFVTLLMRRELVMRGMPTDSVCKIGHASCHHQMCAENPDNRSEAALHQDLRGCVRYICSLSVQDYHRWWELVSWLWSRNKATVLPTEKSNFVTVRSHIYRSTLISHSII